ncbi:hypothetical protein HYZ97_01520 [Candidatus Pacearchaeota archaeon]|nr:hypothetical protein [Candidatus Pacearchaeota archaeon]
MARVRDFLQEYLLGAKTISFYREQKRFYVEYVLDAQDRMAIYNHLDLEQHVHIALGRVVPGILDAAVLSCAAATNEPPYLLAISQGMRFFAYTIERKRQKKLALIQKAIQDRHEFCNNLRQTANKIRFEWKLPFRQKYRHHDTHH